ncbi:hypothetical protein [Desmonostoc muscorum]|uniref:hypothetical protein n=1 Tax=Desmonostoc muscorum TaxID=1179 RepID=UPI001F422403|nr:hypothetical protein [Desmonostoc muscorum]
MRQIRHELFDSEFQIELATVFKDSSVGLCPVHKTNTQVNKSIEDARQIKQQDVEEAVDGSPKLRKGVVKDRR